MQYKTQDNGQYTGPLQGEGQSPPRIFGSVNNNGSKKLKINNKKSKQEAVFWYVFKERYPHKCFLFNKIDIVAL